MITILTADTDFGPVEGSTSGSRHVLASDQREYLIKGPTLATVPHRYLAANEMISAEIGQLLGVPVLEWAFVRYEGHLCFGSRWLSDRFQHVSADTLATCANLSQIHSLVVFDTFVYNTDRHEKNMLVVDNPSGTRAFVVIDHANCLLGTDRDPRGLRYETVLNSPPEAHVTYVPPVVSAVTDASLLEAALQRLEALSDAEFSRILGSVPHEWLPEADREPLSEFLIQRKGRLRQVFQAGLGVFSNLLGEGLPAGNSGDESSV